ncbi:hypothetical protein ACRQ1B_19140 [Rhizobium panacihumi]|uniref:hypothetical protein n=1 Tax=Rhizobium panacihumi TaxID=2008450 RepID=UPI003D7A70E4
MLSIVLNNFYVLPYKAPNAQFVGVIKFLHGFIRPAVPQARHFSCEGRARVLPG